METRLDLKKAIHSETHLANSTDCPMECLHLDSQKDYQTESQTVNRTVRWRVRHSDWNWASRWDFH
jgi:hypothetical protein